MTAIYILKLRDGKYYVGKSDNVEKRFEQHLEGKGSAWTKKYSPIKIERTIPNSSPFEEDRYVKEYMAKYGVENVRGGAYTQISLGDDITAHIEKEIRGATDKCMKCGEAGHFVANCTGPTQSEDIEDEDVWEAEIPKKENILKNVMFECERCDRSFGSNYGLMLHTRSCRNVSWGCSICDEEFDIKSEAESHQKRCKPKKTTGTCYRCGRSGHYSPDCYAKSVSFKL
jgi:hypothetical protein